MTMRVTRGCNRLTLMLKRNGDVVARDDGVDRTSMKMSEEWVGLSIFYTNDMSTSEEKCVRYAPVGVDQGSVDQA